MISVSEILSDYTIEKEMGRGGFAITWLARPNNVSPQDISASQPVILKELLLDAITDWKALEAFEREARILSHLHHPGIPTFIDFIEKETAGGKRLFLVQSFIEGQDLEVLIQSGRYFTEAEVIEMALQVCRILIYLHGFSPPIVHRDIKPGNIMRSAKASDYYLVDFGAVKAPENIGSYTTTGTVGYMPLEQLEGKASPASDIYSLGMTLIYVLSHQVPREMNKKGLRVDFRPHVNIREAFARIIDKMIAPDIQHRYAQAEAVLADLEHLQEERPFFSAWPVGKRYLIPIVLGGLALVSLYFFTASKEPPPEAVSSPSASLPTPETQPTSQELGNYYYAQKKYRDAIPLYDRYLLTTPNAFTERFRRGFSYGHLNQHQKALDDFLYIIQNDPTPDLANYYNVGYHYYKLEQWAQSEIYLKQAHVLTPQNTNVINYLGLVAMESKDPAQALQWFEKAIKIAPDRFLYNNMARVYQDLGKYPEALKAIDQSLHIDQQQVKDIKRQYARPYQHQAEIYFAMGALDKSLAATEQALLRSPRYAVVQGLRAKIFKQRKQCELSLAAATKACERNETDFCKWSCP